MKRQEKSARGGRLSKVRKQDLLESVGLFEHCTKKELAAVAELTTEIEVDPGQVLCKEGEIGLEFFVIVDGSATVSKRGRDEHRIAAGGAFGELALLDGGPRTATVRAATPMRLLALNRGEFRDLLLRAPSVGRKLLLALGTRLRLAEQDITRLEARLAKARSSAE